jgi:hypothetical protein
MLIQRVQTQALTGKSSHDLLACTHVYTTLELHAAHYYAQSLYATRAVVGLFIATLATAMPFFQLETYPGNRARRTNGATQTFRRPSHATSLSGSTNHSTSRDPAAPQNSSTNPGVYVPPHAQPGRNGSSFEGRYSRDQLTQLFRIQQASSDLSDGLSDLYMGGWEPHATNGSSSASWGRKDDHGREREAPSGVDQCWDRDGSILPLSLTDMTDDEKEVRTHTPPHLLDVH